MKIKRYFLFIVLLSILYGCKKDDNDSLKGYSDFWGISPKYWPIEIGNKWGYIDKKGKVKIEPQFDDVGWFCFNMAAYRNNNLLGYINDKGEIEIFAQYIECGQFTREGLAKVRNQKNDYGYIDKKGIVKIGFQFEYALSFHDDMAIIKNNNLFGAINKEGEIVIKPIYEDMYYYSEGLARVSLINEKSGFIDKDGKIVIQAIYDDAGYFSNEMAWIRIEENYGYIDKTGKIVISPTYSNAKAFWEEKAAVKISDKWGYIDKNGKLAIPLVFDEAYYFSDGVACVKQNDYYGFIDHNGDYIIQPQFKNTDEFYNGIAWVMFQDNSWGYIDKEGKIIWKYSSELKEKSMYKNSENRSERMLLNN
ncbi:MAG: WG repeat-containing protein [Bacteroidales bacterium]|nr:WG repeat-containing protein [Bacteroidales bacterium]